MRSRNGTLDVGVTSDVVLRIWQQKNDFVEGFTKRYGVHAFVWIEVHESIRRTFALGMAIEYWWADESRWNLDLIEKEIPTWRDLCDNGVELDSGFRRNHENLPRT